MRYKVIMAGICALALVASPAFAEKSCMKRDKMMSERGKTGPEKKDEGMFLRKAHMALTKASELGLSDDQVQKIKDLKYSRKKAMIKQDADIETLAMDIKQALGKDEVDVNSVNKLIDKKYALKADKAKGDVQACADIKKILTPDQSKKLKEMCMMPGGMMKHGMMEKKKEGQGMMMGLGPGEKKK